MLAVIVAQPLKQRQADFCIDFALKEILGYSKIALGRKVRTGDDENAQVTKRLRVQKEAEPTIE